MKQSIAAGLMLVAAMSLAQAQDMPVDDRWYVGVMGGVARPGEDRRTDSTAPYFGAYFGRFFSHDFSLDVQIDSYSTEFERDKLDRAGIGIPGGDSFDDDFDIYGYGVTGRYHFGEPENRVRPYGLIGLGIQEHDSFLDDGRDFYLSWGFGLNSKFGDHIRLRTQLEGRYDNDRETRNSNNGFVDMVASVGLSYSFGKPPAPPRPEPRRQAPPPEPAPEPLPPAPAPEPEKIAEFDSAVTFAFDSAEIRPEAEEELERAAAILEVRDELILIEVAGHTDSIGTEEYNQDLSVRRAQSVADFLADQGISRDRMEIRGYGESRPVVPNTSPENRARNRRVVLSVLETANQ